MTATQTSSQTMKFLCATQKDYEQYFAFNIVPRNTLSTETYLSNQTLSASATRQVRLRTTLLHSSTSSAITTGIALNGKNWTTESSAVRWLNKMIQINCLSLHAERYDDNVVNLQMQGVGSSESANWGNLNAFIAHDNPVPSRCGDATEGLTTRTYVLFWREYEVRTSLVKL